MEISRLPAELRSYLRSGVAITSVAQCVEELLLNALDAGSTCVAVRVDLACYKVQVVDNGSGIQHDHLHLLGQRYATSKCHTVADLDHLNYFGYRGEALASIADACSVLEVMTRTGKSAKTYSKLFQQGRALSIVESKASRPSVGTTVTVHDLFHSFPVRRKSTSVSLELERICQRVEGLALIRPDASISLRNDATGHVLLQTHKSGNLLKTFTQLFGGARARSLAAVDCCRGNISLNGYIGKEFHTKKDCQFIYVNKRLVLNTKIHKLVNQLLSKSPMFKDRAENQISPLLKKENSVFNIKQAKNYDKFPVYVIDVTCPFKDYDITFDPSKTLVEFKDWDLLLTCATECVDSFMKRENLLYSTVPDVVPQSGNGDTPANETKTESGPSISPSNLRDTLFSKPVRRPRTPPGGPEALLALQEDYNHPAVKKRKAGMKLTPSLTAGSSSVGEDNDSSLVSSSDLSEDCDTTGENSTLSTLEEHTELPCTGHRTVAVTSRVVSEASCSVGPGGDNRGRTGGGERQSAVVQAPVNIPSTDSTGAASTHCRPGPVTSSLSEFRKAIGKKANVHQSLDECLRTSLRKGASAGGAVPSLAHLPSKVFASSLQMFRKNPKFGGVGAQTSDALTVAPSVTSRAQANHSVDTTVSTVADSSVSVESLVPDKGTGAGSQVRMETCDDVAAPCPLSGAAGQQTPPPLGSFNKPRHTEDLQAESISSFDSEQDQDRCHHSLPGHGPADRMQHHDLPVMDLDRIGLIDAQDRANRKRQLPVQKDYTVAYKLSRLMRSTSSTVAPSAKASGSVDVAALPYTCSESVVGEASRMEEGFCRERLNEGQSTSKTSNLKTFEQDSISVDAEMPIAAADENDHSQVATSSDVISSQDKGNGKQFLSKPLDADQNISVLLHTETNLQHQPGIIQGVASGIVGEQRTVQSRLTEQCHVNAASSSVEPELPNSVEGGQEIVQNLNVGTREQYDMNAVTSGRNYIGLETAKYLSNMEQMPERVAAVDMQRKCTENLPLCNVLATESCDNSSWPTETQAFSPGLNGTQPFTPQVTPVEESPCTDKKATDSYTPPQAEAESMPFYPGTQRFSPKLSDSPTEPKQTGTFDGDPSPVLKNTYIERQQEHKHHNLHSSRSMYPDEDKAMEIPSPQNPLCVSFVKKPTDENSEDKAYLKLGCPKEIGIPSSQQAFDVSSNANKSPTDENMEDRPGSPESSNTLNDTYEGSSQDSALHPYQEVQQGRPPQWEESECGGRSTNLTQLLQAADVTGDQSSMSGSDTQSAHKDDQVTFSDIFSSQTSTDELNVCSAATVESQPAFAVGSASTPQYMPTNTDVTNSFHGIDQEGHSLRSPPMHSEREAQNSFQLSTSSSEEKMCLSGKGLAEVTCVSQFSSWNPSDEIPSQALNNMEDITVPAIVNKDARPMEPPEWQCNPRFRKPLFEEKEGSETFFQQSEDGLQSDVALLGSFTTEQVTGHDRVKTREVAYQDRDTAASDEDPVTMESHPDQLVVSTVTCNHDNHQLPGVEQTEAQRVEAKEEWDDVAQVSDTLTEVDDLVKWRNRSDPAVAQTGQEEEQRVTRVCSVEQLFAEWENPVFSKPEQEITKADKQQTASVLVTAQTSMYACKFSKAMLANLKMLGQVDNKFIAGLLNTDETSQSSAPNMLVVIDQHAAHERVRLEALTEAAQMKLAGGATVVRQVDVTPPEAMFLSEDCVRVMKTFRHEFTRIGVEFCEDRKDKRRVVIQTIPACIVEREASEVKRKRDPVAWDLVQSLLEEHVELLRKTDGAGGQLPQTLHKLLCSQACHGAIKFGDALEAKDCQELVRSLAECRLPFQCAHGRPSVMPLMHLDQLHSSPSCQKQRPPNLSKLKRQLGKKKHTE